MAVVLFGFTRLHGTAGRSVASATANAHTVQSIEQTFHVNIELAANRWLTEHHAVIAPAVLTYRLYYVVLLGVLIWVYVRHAAIYVRVRRTFLAMIGLALLVFWVLPVSPPRFALVGIVDVIAQHDILVHHATRDVSNGANLTAMPSLHVGWSAWCAYAVWSAGRGAHPRAAWLAWLFPLVMAADVLATGNHYVLDVVGSGLLLGASVAVANGFKLLVKRRPGAAGQRVPSRAGRSHDGIDREDA